VAGRGLAVSWSMPGSARMALPGGGVGDGQDEGVLPVDGLHAEGGGEAFA
jgi:hypothetical protein